mmetsp:Transcript_8366/g.34445  ORF Transcript_8366/g.34445 Transcript_8366/m.34445 type:complete len:209 (-) Transcript_8366:486-1112(-)
MKGRGARRTSSRPPPWVGSCSRASSPKNANGVGNWAQMSATVNRRRDRIQSSTSHASARAKATTPGLLRDDARSNARLAVPRAARTQPGEASTPRTAWSGYASASATAEAPSPHPRSTMSGLGLRESHAEIAASSSAKASARDVSAASADGRCRDARHRHRFARSVKTVSGSSSSSSSLASLRMARYAGKTRCERSTSHAASFSTTVR